MLQINLLRSENLRREKNQKKKRLINTLTTIFFLLLFLGIFLVYKVGGWPGIAIIAIIILLAKLGEKISTLRYSSST